MKLKGVKELNNSIYSVVKHFTTAVKECRLNTDFSCDLDNDIIYYSPFITELSDKAMRENVHTSHGYAIPYDEMFLFSLFHEIGHFETLDDMTKEDWDIDKQKKEELEKKLILFGVGEESYQYRLKYYECPSEYLANDWAASNFKTINDYERKAINRKLMTALNKFYEINNVWG